ncbi:hypothetical protein PORY_000400 [Pneumocystis oryctolagi]|uniref:Uncharacterized protein n=1 Tax=Pneumocystis oryctolagi TaxID=42067 RepID=A0ACB7CGQ1_9ASCO|nr:hypothetical protein PORY_000400 [Pneumocystis oryctolagi]
MNQDHTINTEDNIYSSEDYSSSISETSENLNEQSKPFFDSTTHTFSQFIHKSKKTGQCWAIGSLEKEIAEYSHLLKVLDSEKAHNLSLHLYSSFKLRKEVTEHQHRPLIRKRWTAWPLPPNDHPDLNTSTRASIRLLADELEACIFRIATKKIRNHHLEPTCESELLTNTFHYILKIVTSRIDKLLLTLLYSRSIQGSYSSKSRLQLLRWDDVLGYASIACAFPFKDIINTVNICSFLFSENISWNTIEAPLKLENTEYLKEKGWDVLSEIPSYKKYKKKSRSRKNQSQ